MLHCIRQTSESGVAGASQFADGFHAAEQLRVERPDLWRALVATRVAYRDLNSDALDHFHLLRAHPVIECAHTVLHTLDHLEQYNSEFSARIWTSLLYSIQYVYS